VGEDRQGGRHHQRAVRKSFTAKDARDAKEKKSLTAKDAEDAEEKNSLTAKAAKE